MLLLLLLLPSPWLSSSFCTVIALSAFAVFGCVGHGCVLLVCACVFVQVKGLPYATSEEAQSRLAAKNINYIDRRPRGDDQVGDTRQCATWHRERVEVSFVFAFFWLILPL